MFLRMKFKLLCRSYKVLGIWPLSTSPAPLLHQALGSKQFPSTAAAAAAKLLQSCSTLCNPRDGSPPGSPVPGILQARTSEWVAISFSNAWKWKVKVKSLSCVWLSVTPWTAAYQAPPFMGFSRQEYWSGVPLPPLISLNTPHQFRSQCLENVKWMSLSSVWLFTTPWTIQSMEFSRPEYWSG